MESRNRERADQLTLSLPGSLIRASAIVFACLLVSILVWRGTRGAFVDSTANVGNSITAGTVTLTDDDSGAALIGVSGLGPGATLERCITVTYEGSLTPAAVRLYATSGGTGLDAYLDTTAQVGSGGSFGDCNGFTASSTLASGTLADFATTHHDWSSGVAAFTANANPTARTFRFTFTVRDDNSAQGLTATPTFTWEAQSS